MSDPSPSAFFKQSGSRQEMCLRIAEFESSVAETPEIIASAFAARSPASHFFKYLSRLQPVVRAEIKKNSVPERRGVST